VRQQDHDDDENVKT